MAEALNADALLERLLATFWGYGSLTAPWWMVGMEEGGGDTWDAIVDHLKTWRAQGDPQMAPFDPRPTSALRIPGSGATSVSNRTGCLSPVWRLIRDTATTTRRSARSGPNLDEWQARGW